MFGSASFTVDPASDQALELGAGGVVFDPDGKVLMLRRKCGDWVFPKGHIDDGESAAQAAVREIAEEAGVSANCSDRLLSWNTGYVNSHGRRRKIIWFACETEDRQVALGEALFPEGGFFDPPEALGRLSYQADRDLLAAVLSWRADRSRGAG